MMLADRRVLIVDDDKRITKLVAERLRRHGFEVDEIHDALAALRHIQENSIHIVILDVDMPELSGHELLRLIKAYDGSIQVIMMTGYETLGNLTAAFQGGAEYMVIKPITEIDSLLNSVEACHAKITHWSQVIDSVRKLAVVA